MVCKPQPKKLQRRRQPEKEKEKKKEPRRPAQNQTSTRQQQKPQSQSKSQDQNELNEHGIDLSKTIPLLLQQLLLNVFKSALLPQDPTTNSAELDTKSLIQTIKSHLYNRDFDSAFTDANEELLRAYALRWSASRALGYVGIFKGIVKALPDRADGRRVVCIGGGAGAEIVALASVWRDEGDEGVRGVGDELGKISLDDQDNDDAPDSSEKDIKESNKSVPRLAVTAVDIADWSSVVDRLSTTIQSPNVPSSKSCPAPLLPSQDDGEKNLSTSTARFTVDFQRSDILTLPDDELKNLFPASSIAMVTLMFTLNELFSTSMAKTTAFLLRMTDTLQPGTLLLVIDSPGSYSTLKLGKKSGEEESKPAERQYPMKFLLNHTLLSVAQGKWESIYSQDSRWWRRDAAKLGYVVGEGAGLEDMRYQVHIYRRL